MVGAELASWIFGSLGIGGGVVSLYIRFSIADTIIDKLDKRYTGTPMCVERHTNLSHQLLKIERQTERIDEKVISGFASLQDQLFRAQESRKAIERDQIDRDQDL